VGDFVSVSQEERGLKQIAKVARCLSAAAGARAAFGAFARKLPVTLCRRTGMDGASERARA